MKDPKDLLLSAMLPIDMLDDNDDTTQSEVVGDVIVQYDFLQIIENIGQEDFQETYLIFIEDIQKQSFDNQRTLCYHIIDKVQEVYGFEFPEIIDVYDVSDVDDIYKFIQFLEYDNIDFLVNILKGFDVNFLQIDPYEFCINNQEKIIKQINFYDKVRLPSIFVNLYDTLKNNIIINMIGRMISKNKGLITNELKIRELGGM